MRMLAKLRQTKSNRPLLSWLAHITPSFRWDWPYMLTIIDALNAVTAGECKRLMLFLPPRHGKSECATVRYPVYRLLRDPSERVIIGAYNQTLASTFSRKARRVAVQAGLLTDTDKAAADHWELSAGGGLLAVGVGAGVTGHGADLIVVDDPVKSREEANSQTYRDRVYEWYTDDLYTRLQPNGAIVLIMTRWHADDLAGRILASQGAQDWRVVSLPALAEENDPLGRAPGRALCPERFDESALASIRTVLGEYGFSALYQQRPLPASGGMFKRQWLTIVSAGPASAEARVRYWDRAATAGGGDYTVGARMSKTADGIFHVEDVVRGQWSSGERDAVILQTAQTDPPGTVIWLEQEPGSGGVDSVAALTRKLAGYAVRADKVTGDKVTRADPLASQCEAGNVRLVAGPWNAAFIDELCAFPFGANDDQVDSASGAFGKVSGKVIRHGYFGKA